MAYGQELILDLHGCDSTLFNRESIEEYLKKLCALIDMQRADLHFWDDVGVPLEDQQTEPHLKGTSAIQFIMTSSITIHTLDLLGKAFINLFSCKPFNSAVVRQFTEEWFDGGIVSSHEIARL